MSKKSQGSFSSAMALEDHFPEAANGGTGDAADGHGKGRGGRKGQKHRNSRSKSHTKENGQSSKEQTPEAKEKQGSPPDAAVTAVQVGGSPNVEPAQPLSPSVNSSPETKNVSQPTWDATSTEDTDAEAFVTANNSSEADSINGNLETPAPAVLGSKEYEEDFHNSNTSISTGTLTPTNNESVIYDDEKTFNNSPNATDQVLPGDDSNNPIVLDESTADSFEEGVTNASIAVQMSDTVADPLAFQSFMTESSSLESSLSSSPPLSSSRSVPPDLSTILEQDRDDHVSQNNTTASIMYPNLQNQQFQTSTPIASSNVFPSRRNRTGSNEMNFTTGEAPSTIYVADQTSTVMDQEERYPTYVARANRAFVDLEEEASAGVTKESGICDMSATKDFKNSVENDDSIPLPPSAKEVQNTASRQVAEEAENDVVDVEPNVCNEQVAVSVQASVSTVPKPTGTVSKQPVPVFDSRTELKPTPTATLEVPVENDPISDADEEVEEINKPFMLPSTVTELTAANGIKVYVVGTAHFSRQSQLDVIETMEKVQPGIVVLELCRSRSGMLSMNEEEILREAADMSLAKIQQTIKQSGPVQGLLHVLLLQMTASLTKKLGMAPGGEFRVALQEAHKIPGCNIHFGDRNLAITLNRALSGLGFFQKIRLAWHFLRANDTDITKEEVEACKEKDLLEKLLVEMAGEFPAITRVLLDERDLYLANSLWLAATGTQIDHRGNLLRNTRPIVGVVGMGHVAGITRNWGPIDPEKMAEIVTIPETPLSHVIIGKAIRFSCYTLLGFVIYKSSRKLFSFPSDAMISAVVGTASSTFAKINSKVTGKF